MEFCEICDNMLYVKSNDTNMLVKYCKHCEFEIEMEMQTNPTQIVPV